MLWVSDQIIDSRPRQIKNALVTWNSITDFAS